MMFKTIKVKDLDQQQRQQISELCFAAFDEAPWDQYKFMQDATHIVAILDNQIVSHALWTDRVFTIDDITSHVAYIEYVTTDHKLRGKGLASELLKYLINTLIKLNYDLAALQPEDEAFYQKIGWETWQGSLYINHDKSIDFSEDVQIMLYPLNNQLSDKVSSSSKNNLIYSDWREGEIW